VAITCGTTITRYPTGAVAFDMTRHIPKCPQTRHGQRACCSRRHHQLSSKHPRQHTYRPKEFQSWVIYNISQNRHDINKTRMFTLQNTSPEVTTRTPSKPYATLKGSLAQSPCILLKDLSCVAMSMPPMPMGEPVSTTSLTITSVPHLPIYTQNLCSGHCCLGYALRVLRPGSTVQASSSLSQCTSSIRFPQLKPTPIYMDNQPAIDT
jgi:hypothetical protein